VFGRIQFKTRSIRGTNNSSAKNALVEITQETLNRITQLEPKLHSFLCGRYSFVTGKGSGCQNRRGKKSGWDSYRYQRQYVYARNYYASRMLENFVPESRNSGRDGAVMVGKTNLDEFAMGSSTENSAYQVTANPWDVSRVPGELFSRSCSVRMRSCYRLHTGGSIRQPASFAVWWNETNLG